MSFCSKESFSPHIYVVLEIRISTNCNCGQKNVKTQFFAIFESGNLNILGLVLGFLTESNKPYSVNGVTGPILKNTTKVTWAGRESKSPSQRAPVADTVKRGGGGGKVIQTNAGRRMMLSQGYTGLSTRHTSLLSLITCIKILRLRLRN